MAHFIEGYSKRRSIFCVVKECSRFGFGCGRDNGLHDGAVDVDCSIDGWRGGIWTWVFFGRFVAEKKDAAARDLALATERYDASLWM
jgi:hypothetical protein